MLILTLAGCKNKISYYDNACTAMEKGNYEEAIENYNKAIMEDEELQSSYRGAGISYFRVGDYEKAEEFFVRGLRESKGIVSDIELDMSYYLAETYVCLGENDKALDVYTNIINLKEYFSIIIYSTVFVLNLIFLFFFCVLNMKILLFLY